MIFNFGKNHTQMHKYEIFSYVDWIIKICINIFKAQCTNFIVLIPLVVLSHLLIGLYAYSPICDLYYVTCNGTCNGGFFINKDYTKTCEQMSLFPLVLWAFDLWAFVLWAFVMWAFVLWAYVCAPIPSANRFPIRVETTDYTNRVQTNN